MKFEAKTLEDVYKKATEKLNKSISELDIKILQHPSNGIFGFFAKNAIIEVLNVDKISDSNSVEKVENLTFDIEKENRQNINEVIHIITKEINELFELGCFEIDKIDVRVYDEDTIMFEINGKDSALLIGKEGYRYNALATLLFNWISQKYGYKTKLEIASFLESQEEMMRKFLASTIREIEEKGRCKTKSFDGVLAYIAVDILRQEFPHKYVAIKKNRDGSQYVIVNEFLNKKDD
jgi:spoIIIJ-associated protein